MGRPRILLLLSGALILTVAATASAETVAPSPNTPPPALVETSHGVATLHAGSYCWLSIPTGAPPSSCVIADPGPPPADPQKGGIPLVVGELVTFRLAFVPSTLNIGFGWGLGRIQGFPLDPEPTSSFEVRADSTGGPTILSTTSDNGWAVYHTRFAIFAPGPDGVPRRALPGGGFELLNADGGTSVLNDQPTPAPPDDRTGAGAPAPPAVCAPPQAMVVTIHGRLALPLQLAACPPATGGGSPGQPPPRLVVRRGELVRFRFGSAPRRVVRLTVSRDRRSRVYRLSPYAATWRVRGRGGAMVISTAFAAGDPAGATDASYSARLVVR